MLTEIRFNMDEMDKDDLMQYCKDTFSPAECCNEDELEEWAKDNGWVEKDELDAAEEEIARLMDRVEELEEAE